MSMQRIIDDFVKGAANNGFGRPITIQLAKEAGVQDALKQFLPPLKNVGAQLGKGARKFMNDPHKMELAGLGLLAAPVVHDLIGDDHESRATRTAKRITELVGLGVLGHSTLKEMH